MSREVLGAAGPENEPAASPSASTGTSHARGDEHEPSGRVAVLDLDADPSGVADPRAGDPGGTDPRADEPRADEPRAGRTGAARTSPGATAVLPASPRTAGPPASPPRSDRWSSWWYHPRRALASAALAAALVTALLTTAVLERQQEARRYADVRLVAEVIRTGGGGGGDDPVSSFEASLVVLNTGRDAVHVVGAGFDGATGARVEVPREVRVPARGSAHVPARVDLDCSGTPPTALDLRVRTQDGRERTVPAGSFFDALNPGPALQDLFMACDTTVGQGVDIWSTTARPDGTLSMRVRNPGGDPVTVSFRGPAGTRIESEPAAPLTIPGRSGVSVVLTVKVERCTAAAQRAAAADDVMVVTDDLNIASLWGGSEVAGWFARSIALQCG